MSGHQAWQGSVLGAETETGFIKHGSLENSVSIGNNLETNGENGDFSSPSPSSWIFIREFGVKKKDSITVITNTS